MASQCAIIVSSCDKYEDVLTPFFTLFFRFWPDCPFPIYLVGTTKTYVDSRVQWVPLKKDLGWASNMKEALRVASAPNIIYFQEDYFLNRPVDTRRIIETINFLDNSEAIGCVRFFPAPPGDTPFENTKMFRKVSPGKKYRISTQTALWRGTFLDALLVKGESGWDFEEKGTKRAEDMPDFVITVPRRNPPVSYYFRTAIKRGKWYPGAIRLCRKWGVPVNISARPIMSSYRVFLGDIRRFLEKVGVFSIARGVKRLINST